MNLLVSMSSDTTDIVKVMKKMMMLYTHYTDSQSSAFAYIPSIQLGVPKV